MLPGGFVSISNRSVVMVAEKNDYVVDLLKIEFKKYHKPSAAQKEPVCLAQLMEHKTLVRLQLNP